MEFMSRNIDNCNIFCYNFCRILSEITERGKKMLEKIDIHITDHCNLNCKGCNHFSPISKEFYLDTEEYSRDIERLAKLSNGEIGKIFLIGGEPLLHPQLKDFFTITRRNFPNSRIIIITNGILLLKQDNTFWEACKNSKVEIWLSQYHLNLDYDLMKQTAAKYSVFFGNTTDIGEDSNNWYKWKLDLNGEQNPDSAYKNCVLKKCVALKHGKVFTCCTSAHIDQFNNYFNKNLELSEDDYVDIYKANSFDEIIQKISNPIPFCKYCKPAQWEYTKWEHSKKEISEWI